ncbi:hypothetical protein [Paenibacillus sp. ISL-20]|uniref:hypothetical protein n=1 Tax=Paenibacillus sp. ISL-20 TaxID=2819163 RepID=UPI001BEAC46A|nr:hypothetical protein [Paenibacillus sp. ISL-20]MBT2763307.1 hypothetical protein [Paenibacillus sp. ISL-20]
MFKLIIFVMIVSLIGFSVIISLPKKMNVVTSVSLIFPIGSVVITLYCWLLSLIRIDYSFEVIFIPLIVLALIGVAYKLFSKKTNSSQNSQIEEKVKQSLFLRIIFVFVIAVLVLKFVTILFYSISTKVYQPDEYSQWAFQAKMIYLGKGLESFYGGMGFETGFETYPSFIPLLVACYYFFSGEIIDSFVRVIGPIFLASLLIFIYTQLNSFVKNKLINLLLIGIYISSGFVVFEMSSGLYADIEYTYFYTISVVMFIKHLIQKSDISALIYSGMFMGFASWVKTDGQYLAFIHLAIICLIYIINHLSKEKIRNIFIYAIISFAIPVLWKLYTSLNEFPISRWALNPKPEYTLPMISASIQQILNTTNWGLFWVLVFAFMVVNLYVGFNKQQAYMLLIIFSNIVFLYISYIFMFGEEAKSAASFSRYILRIAPLSLLYVSTVLCIVLKKNMEFGVRLNENSNNNSSI